MNRYMAAMMAAGNDPSRVAAIQRAALIAQEDSRAVLTPLQRAAPDLLSACKAYVYGQKEPRECEAMMLAAIAKAESL